MKKILFFLIIGSFLTLTANAQQNCHWAKTAGSSLDDAIYKITGDNSGNVLLALSFQDTVIFGTDSAFSNGGLDGLIVKLNEAGNMVWGQQIAGSGNIVVSGIATDAQDNVYITGYFYGTAYFGTSISHQSMGLADLYVAKISSTGSWQWVKTNGDALAQLGRDIAVTPWGDVVVGGEFGGKLYFNTDSVVATTPDNGFVALLNGNNGNWKWIKRIAGSSSVNSVDAHISSKIVLGGTFSGTAVFGSTNLNASGGTDGFIAVIDSTGLYQWAVKAGGTSADAVTAVKFIPSGKIFASGWFNSIGQFGINLLSSAGGSDVFVSMLTATGTWQWALRAGGIGDDVAGALSIDANRFAVLGGSFEGTATFGTTNLTSAGSKDLFISRMDTTGAWQWAYRQGGAGEVSLSSVHVNSDNFILIGANFQNSINIMGTPFTSKGLSDMLLMRVDRNLFGWGKPFSVSTASTIMCGDSINLIATPNDSYLSYAWTPAADFVNPALANVTAFPVATGYLKATATLGGCSVRDSVLITVSPLPLDAGSNQSMSCGGTVQLNASLTTPVSGVSYAWSPGATLSSTTIANPFASPSVTTTYTVSATKGQCLSTDSMVVSVGALPVDSICLVTVDDTLNKNTIVFEKHTLGPVAYYKIYRETFVANQYDSIGFVHPDSAGYFADMTSNPVVKADRYKISLVDSCGFESVLSPEHKTMHLSINQGAGISWNLIWSPYVGFTVPTYRIWRGATLTNMVLIDSVPGTSVSYTDLTPPAGGLYYQVEIISPKTCYPYINTKAATSYNSSRSNQADNGQIQPIVVAADFSASPLTGLAPLMVTFTDISTGGPTDWLWYFGDGDTSHVQNPVHTYTTPGLFTVKLVAWNSMSSDSLEMIDYIMVSNSVSEIDLNASFKIFPNPVKDDILSISSPLLPVQSIILKDLSGRTLLQQSGLNTYSSTLQLTGMPKGIYLLQALMANGSIVNRKLVLD
jgi:hypothetical protein